MAQLINNSLKSIKTLAERSRLFPKFFHYFAASLLLDFAFLMLSMFLFIEEHNWVWVSVFWSVASIIKYPRIRMRRYVRYADIFNLTLVQLVIFGALYTAFFSLSNNVWRQEYLYDFLILSSCLMLSKMCFVYLVRLYRKSGYGYNRFLMIGNAEELKVIADLIVDQQYSGCQLDEILESQPSIQQLERRITTKALNEIYCSADIKDYLWLTDVLNLSSKYGVSLYIVSDAKQFKNWRSITSVNREVLDGTMQYFPLLDKRNMVIKRAFDLALSVVIILGVLSWMIPILAIIIRMESKGPVFFLQARAGRGGELFKCIKFRSMIPSKHFEQAKKDDHRVTKFGAFLRRTSLDEFPQFFNVFLGQMSIVGPRPHVKQLNDKFVNEIQNYDDRLLVKPGITGLSQVMGYRGETRDLESMADRIRVDLSYIKNWTLLVDIKIVLKTVTHVLLKRENAY